MYTAPADTAVVDQQVWTQLYCLVAPSMNFSVSTMPDGYSLLTQWQLLYDGGPSINAFTIKVSLLAIPASLLF